MTTRATVTASDFKAAAKERKPLRLNWTTTQPTTIPVGQIMIAVSDGTIRYYATCPRKRAVISIGRAFAQGFDHGESTGIVTATIERMVSRVVGCFVHRSAPKWETLGRVTFGPDGVVSLA